MRGVDVYRKTDPTQTLVSPRSGPPRRGPSPPSPSGPLRLTRSGGAPARRAAGRRGDRQRVETVNRDRQIVPVASDMCSNLTRCWSRVPSPRACGAGRPRRQRDGWVGLKGALKLACLADATTVVVSQKKALLAPTFSSSAFLRRIRQCGGRPIGLHGSRDLFCSRCCVLGAGHVCLGLHATGLRLCSAPSIPGWNGANSSPSIDSLDATDGHAREAASTLLPDRCSSSRRGNARRSRRLCCLSSAREHALVAAVSSSMYITCARLPMSPRSRRFRKRGRTSRRPDF